MREREREREGGGKKRRKINGERKGVINSPEEKRDCNK